MWEIWANYLLPQALKSCTKSNKLPNLITLFPSLFGLFWGFFKQILQQMNVNIFPSSILSWDSNPRPSEHESHPITLLNSIEKRIRGPRSSVDSSVSSCLYLGFGFESLKAWLIRSILQLIFWKLSIENVKMTTSSWCYKTIFGGNLENLDFPLSWNSKNSID